MLFLTPRSWRLFFGGGYLERQRLRFFDVLVKGDVRWQSKKFKIKASQIPKNEAYLSYAAVTRGAAQRSRPLCGNWAFYEAIIEGEPFQ